MRACPISAAAAYPLSSTLHLPFHISQGSVEQLENVLLVLQDAEGKESLLSLIHISEPTRPY